MEPQVSSRRIPMPPPLVPPPRPGWFRRTPPAIFPPILGLFGLGLAWRAGRGAFGVPGAPVEGFLGAVVLLFAFACLAYGAKMVRRPGVWAEDLRTLPGRTGLSALTMAAMLAAAVLVPYAPAVAAALLWAGLGAHVATALTVTWMLATGRTSGPVTPALLLVHVGVIVAPAAALPLGHDALVAVVVWYSVVAAVAVSGGTLAPLLTGAAPPPLRPLQTIHLAPASLIAGAAFATGQATLAWVMLGWASAVLALLVLRARWLTAAGFSGFWSAFTFPLAAYAGAWFALWATEGGEGARIAGGLTLVAATLVTLPVAFLVLRLWARGTLATKTNAAEA